MGTGQRSAARVGAVLIALCATLAAAACGTRTGAQPAAAPAAAPTSTSAPAPSPPAGRDAAAVTSQPPHAKPEPAPKPNACRGNTRAQLVLVSISAQHLWLCTRARQVYETAVTTGAVALPYRATPTGTFRIEGRNTNSVLTLNTGKQYHVKYWIPFQAPEFGFHDSPWQHFPYGSPRYRTQGSHGCIHLPLQAIEFLYHWVHIGTTVKIRA